MQLASTTDYAIRIVCYLAAQRQMISTSELSQELSVPSSYIPKITKKLKQAGIIWQLLVVWKKIVFAQEI